MTEAEALSQMKRKCKVLAELFSDADLTGFLTDWRTGDGVDVPYEWDVRRSTYDALTSALTVMEQSVTRGGVSVTYADLFKLRRQYATAGVISLAPDEQRV